ncbi:hypothetical protein [Microbacterium sp.]|uniref:hypothetical protein n=1 Tax=Microbacterium sp. TaxID=51671 RepID=UPI003F991DEA
MTTSATKVTVTVLSLLTVVGLIALAAPLITATWNVVTPVLAAASTSAPAVPGSESTVQPTAGSTARPVDAAADLAAARAEDPHPTDMNHPSRWAGSCTQNSMMTASGSLRGAQKLVDMGPSTFANGSVTFDSAGRIATYTVAPGDAPSAIGERFCVDYVTVFQYNEVYPMFSVQPGAVLSLLPGNK